MRKILRGPVDLGSGEDADFARLHGDRAKNQHGVQLELDLIRWSTSSHRNRQGCTAGQLNEIPKQ